MSINLDLLSNWRAFQPSLCQSCHAHCCALPLEVTAEDLFRLGLLTEEEKNLSLKKVGKILSKRKLIKSSRVRTGLFTLEQKPNGECIFLDRDKRCTVYEKRPDTCRDFPSRVGPKVGFCPYESKGPQR